MFIENGSRRNRNKTIQMKRTVKIRHSTPNPKGHAYVRWTVSTYIRLRVKAVHCFGFLINNVEIHNFISVLLKQKPAKIGLLRAIQVITHLGLVAIIRTMPRTLSICRASSALPCSTVYKQWAWSNTFNNPGRRLLPM